MLGQTAGAFRAQFLRGFIKEKTRFILILMRKIGWYGESYRHALSARGISNKRYSFNKRKAFASQVLMQPQLMQNYDYIPPIDSSQVISQFRQDQLLGGQRYVANSRKGNPTSPFDVKIINPKTGKVVDLKKSLQARGIKTTGGRDYRKVGDQVVPNIGPVLAPSGEIMNMGPTFTEEELTGIPSQVPMETIESAMPTALASYGLEQQAQQVEGSIPFEEQSQVGSAPLPILPERPKVTEAVEGKDISKSGLIEIPEVGTTDVFEPSPMDMERH